jgi:predicted transcriptional regulator
VKKTLGKNRDRISIVAPILEASRNGASKTHIMFQANLSYKLLEKYLTTATEAGFIELHDTSYQLTTKGQNFLDQYRAFYNEYSKLQVSLQALGDEHDKLDRQCTKGILCTQQTILEDEL